MSVHNAVQRLRKFFGLCQAVVDRPAGSSSGRAVGSSAWETYRSASSTSIKVSGGLNKTEFHYEDLGDSSSKYVSQGFNQICSEEGVQVTVTLDPQTYGNLLFIKNVSEKIIKVMLDEDEWMVWPKEEKILKVPYGVRPYIVAINNGNADA